MQPTFTYTNIQLGFSNQCPIQLFYKPLDSMLQFEFKKMCEMFFFGLFKKYLRQKSYLKNYKSNQQSKSNSVKTETKIKCNLKYKYSTNLKIYLTEKRNKLLHSILFYEVVFEKYKIIIQFRYLLELEKKKVELLVF